MNFLAKMASLFDEMATACREEELKLTEMFRWAQDRASASPPALTDWGSTTPEAPEAPPLHPPTFQQSPVDPGPPAGASVLNPSLLAESRNQSSQSLPPFPSPDQRGHGVDEVQS